LSGVCGVRRTLVTLYVFAKPDIGASEANGGFVPHSGRQCKAH
jgi:hypothetical protein